MRLKKIIYIAIITALVIAVLNLLLGAGNAVWHNFHYYLIYSAVFTFGNSLYFKYIGQWLNWHKSPEKTFIISVLGAIPVNAGIYLTINYVIKGLLKGKSFSAFIQHENLLEYIIVVMFALIISLFIMTFYFFKAIREAELKAEQLKTENERSKFNSLKNQLDPHFLFNNLNVLTALIGENPKEAENFSLQLADIYKYVLEQKDRDTVPLQDEIKFAAKYLNLYQMRFEDAIQFHLPDSIPKHAQIPPLSLQIVLENCMKHNQISSDKPLQIQIKIQEKYLVIKNNLNKKLAPERKGYGLQNIQKRYALLNAPKPIFTETANSFIVKLPIL